MNMDPALDAEETFNRLMEQEREDGVVAVCPHCKTKWVWSDDNWFTAIKLHGRHCECPDNWKCTICNKPILTSADFAEYEKNGCHVDCGERELYGLDHFPPEQREEIFDECGGVRLDLIKPRSADETLIDQYRKALEKYADKANWRCSQAYEEGHRCGQYSNCDTRTFVDDDPHEIARDVLEASK
jgi:hypothetical protein